MARLVELDDAFRGPMDLLLHLVRREEIDLHDIPLARLTRAYLDEIAGMEFVSVDDAAEFLSMASILVELKSRSLLPPAELGEDGEDEEEEEDFDPRAGLVKALLEYKRYRQASRFLDALAERHAGRFPRIPEAIPPDGDGGGDDSLDVLGLLMAFKKLLPRMQAPPAAEIVNPHVPTERRMEQIAAALAGGRAVRFSELLSERPSRDEMAGFFIAVLELVRQRRLRARQSLDFADIVLTPHADARGVFPWKPVRRAADPIRWPRFFLDAVRRSFAAKSGPAARPAAVCGRFPPAPPCSRAAVPRARTWTRIAALFPV